MNGAQRYCAAPCGGGKPSVCREILDGKSASNPHCEDSGGPFVHSPGESLPRQSANDATRVAGAGALQIGLPVLGELDAMPAQLPVRAIQTITDGVRATSSRYGIRPHVTSGGAAPREQRPHAESHRQPTRPRAIHPQPWPPPVEPVWTDDRQSPHFAGRFYAHLWKPRHDAAFA